MRAAKRRNIYLSLALLAAAGVVTGIGQSTGLIDLGALFSPVARDRALAASTFEAYCLDCHNAAEAAGGLVLDPRAVADVGAHAEIFEKVVQKLTARSMPPPDEPRPEPAVYGQVSGFLATALDRAAAARPNPGTLPQLHRLTRTEYRNAIRDLLALDALPAEMDYELLLPADNASSGFDNIADLLFVSPVIMERYLDAARKISRLAVGDTTLPVMVNIHRLPLELPQDVAMPGSPLGARGGLVVDSFFPLDAEYVVHVELGRASREQHELEITLDGERMSAARIGGEGPGNRTARELEFRVPISAGPHRLGATFVRRTFALDESTVRVQRRSRGTLPAIELVTINGPYEATGPGRTPSRDRIFVCHPNAAADEVSCAREILATLTRRAYRRPVSDADVDDLMPFFEAGRADFAALGDKAPQGGSGFDAGIQRALERLLVSPQFLYRIERVPDGLEAGEAFDLSPIELASRLSFFVWSSIPDDELLGLAESGRLLDDAVLDAQVERMLADPRADALVDNFAAQWLFLRDVEGKEPDLFVFRDYDEGLREAFIEETERFVASVLEGDASVLELVTANYTFLNQRLAEHYGVPYVEGSRFRRVELPADSPRGGLLGQGSILTLTSYPTRTSPVLRGKYVLDNLLASPPPPPPPDVPALEADAPDERSTKTLREAMAAHRANPSCASCHTRMDAIGFALENFDAVGRWRDTDGGLPIDAYSTLPDGTEVDGLAGVKRLLVAEPERFVSAFTEKLLMYAIGRNIQYYDRSAIRAIVRGAADDDYRFAAIVRGIVHSVPFRMRAAPDAAAGDAPSVIESSETTAALGDGSGAGSGLRR